MALDRRRFLGLTASLAVAPKAWASAAPWQAGFDAFVADGMAGAHVPGMSVAMVRGGRVLMVRGYGYADVATARRVGADTAFHIASLSKTVTGAAMMLLSQDGAFVLDDAIGKTLDFPVVHPQFPDTPITFRHLFTHTSGISDELYDAHDFSSAGDPTLPLRDFLTGYLSPGGQWYDASKSYSAARPGTEWSYSNVAVALLGYMAGRVGPGLETVTRTRLFAPLGMGDTAWRYAQLRGKDLAKPYVFEDARYKELPIAGYPDWPAGLLRTSARDFAKFLTMFTAPRKPFLAPDTLRAILTPDPAIVNKDQSSIHQGLSWLLFDHDGRRIAAHNGGDPGAGSMAAFDAEHRVGALSFANVEPNRDFKHFQDDVVKRLLERARQA